jgi:CPA2 family monovalent cation:H+ antiporter-2
MFGVGLHFSLKDLLSVRAIAVPGAVAQIAAATALGWALAWWLGWPPGGGLVFGLALSVASTVVLLRALQERRLVQTDRGRIAVGWLIVEDIAMVLVLVLLPPIGMLLNAATDSAADAASSIRMRDVWLALGLTIVKVGFFVGLMLVVGRRVIPWILHYIAHTGSRELFRLGVLAIGLGVAFAAAQLFDVSFALGAFFAGMVLAESELSQRAAEESLPLRDAFAVLFFVSVGMLFNPGVLVTSPIAVVAAVLIIVIGKSAAAYAIVRAFGHPRDTAALIAASLAQIGEFSFILAALGVGVGLLPSEGRDLIVTAAIISILLNPLSFLVAERLFPALAPERPAPGAAAPEARKPAPRVVATSASGHTILVGFGRVGGIVGREMEARGLPLVVIEDDDQMTERLAELGIEHIAGNAVLPEVLEAAGVETARVLLVAIPNGFEAAAIVSRAKEINPAIRIVARAHSQAEVDNLIKHGADHVIMGEREIAHGMIELLDTGSRERDGGAGPLLAEDEEEGGHEAAE